MYQLPSSPTPGDPSEAFRGLPFSYAGAGGILGEKAGVPPAPEMGGGRVRGLGGLEEGWEPMGLGGVGRGGGRWLRPFLATGSLIPPSARVWGGRAALQERTDGGPARARRAPR